MSLRWKTVTYPTYRGLRTHLLKNKKKTICGIDLTALRFNKVYGNEKVNCQFCLNLKQTKKDWTGVVGYIIRIQAMIKKELLKHETKNHT